VAAGSATEWKKRSRQATRLGCACSHRIPARAFRAGGGRDREAGEDREITPVPPSRPRGLRSASLQGSPASTQHAPVTCLDPLDLPTRRDVASRSPEPDGSRRREQVQAGPQRTFQIAPWFYCFGAGPARSSLRLLIYLPSGFGLVKVRYELCSRRDLPLV
jgi:hypothetical protein